MNLDERIAQARRFGLVVKARRESASMSQSELARALSCTTEAVERVEDGGVTPTAALYLQLLNATADADEFAFPTDLGL